MTVFLTSEKTPKQNALKLPSVILHEWKVTLHERGTAVIRAEQSLYHKPAAAGSGNPVEVPRDHYPAAAWVMLKDRLSGLYTRLAMAAESEQLLCFDQSALADVFRQPLTMLAVQTSVSYYDVTERDSQPVVGGHYQSYDARYLEAKLCDANTGRAIVTLF